MPRKPEHGSQALTAAERQAKLRTKRLLIKQELEEDLDAFSEVINSLRPAEGNVDNRELLYWVEGIRTRIREL